MKINDKVVCIDDKNQRTDKNHAPNGLVENGKVYVVSGTTSKGGLVIVGLPSISRNSGIETGFRASRFVSLEYHRKEFVLTKNLAVC